mmetsp:Transcript_8539/g.7562  ORF Transcript_8539/g.7562 Transcript_8539/m.7562 type:complete len:128 (+) Transcript_8539:92-475(+)
MRRINYQYMKKIKLPKFKRELRKSIIEKRQPKETKRWYTSKVNLKINKSINPDTKEMQNSSQDSTKFGSESKYQRDYVNYVNKAVTQALFLKEKNGIIKKKKDTDNKKNTSEEQDEIKIIEGILANA